MQMIQSPRERLQAGDCVEVRPPEEIIQTLDASGTLNGLPFMPEMFRECGQRFQVAYRPLQICTDNVPVIDDQSRVRGFIGDDVVLLEGVRCTGLEHGDCKRGCMVFWKDSWLRKVSGSAVPPQRTPVARSVEKLRSAASGPAYFCQSSEILKATRSLSKLDRFAVCLGDIREGNRRVGEVLRHVCIWFFWRAHTTMRGAYPRGNQWPTPTEVLNLQPGEWVEVKSLAEITKTLDSSGRNRGLHFTPDMRLRCGQRYRVRSRASRLIAEGTGHMLSIKNTVLLDGAVNEKAHNTFGSCPRRAYQYWREIWLKRAPPPAPSRRGDP